MSWCHPNITLIFKRWNITMFNIATYYDLAIAAIDGRLGGSYEIASVLSIVLFFNIFVRWVLKVLHKRYLAKRKIWKDSFVQALFLPLMSVVWVFAFAHVINLFLVGIFEEHFIENMKMLRLITGVVGFGWFLLRWKRLLVKLTHQKSKNHEIAIDQGKISVLDKLATIAILFIFSLILLEVFGGSMNTIIAFGGVGGLALAIASQEIIGNFFGGLMIYITRPFTIGDWINLPEKNIEGHVEEIGWYMTRVRTFEKRPIYVPNSIFTKVVVMTPSRMSHRQFVETLSLPLSCATKVKDVIVAIKEMLHSHNDIDHSQTTLVYLKTFAHHSLDIYISAYARTIDSEEYGRVKQDILLKIIEILDQLGAEMQSPKTTVEIPEGIKFLPQIDMAKYEAAGKAFP